MLKVVLHIKRGFVMLVSALNLLRKQSGCPGTGQGAFSREEAAHDSNIGGRDGGLPPRAHAPGLCSLAAVEQYK